MPAAKLAYTVHPGQGPYLGMLHGFLSSSSQWMHNLAALARVCRPVTIDLWGHGHSPSPDDPRAYHPDQYVEALEEIRQTLGTRQWLVCGYSIGAALTIRYTQAYPEHVPAHIFTNSSSAFADTAQIQQWRADAADSAARIHKDGLKAISRIPVHPRFAKRLPADVYATLMKDAQTLCPAGIAHTLTHTTPNASIRHLAADNPRPALLAHGQLETRFMEARNWAFEHMPNLTIVDLQAGHAVNMEDSHGFNTAVTRFVQTHAP
ncbi:MAG: alpha/beta fold hydrolase [bacterium]